MDRTAPCPLRATAARPYRRAGCETGRAPVRYAAMTSRLRPLSEAECYARCYGSATEEVRVVKVERRPRAQLDVSGEDLRRAFEQRLDKREPEAA